MGGRRTRLTRRDIERVFDEGWSVVLPGSVARGRRREDTEPGRIAIVVGRKLGGAAVRNRARRRVTEAVRRSPVVLPAGLDAVLIIRKPLVEASAQELDRDIQRMLARIAEVEANTT